MKKARQADSVRERIDAYFSMCDLGREQRDAKTGDMIVKPVPYTLSGLAEHIGIDRRRILELAAGKGRGGARESIRGALRRIERYTVERVFLGEVQLSAAQLLLRDLGYGAEPAEKQETRVEIVMDDKEGWGE